MSITPIVANEEELGLRRREQERVWQWKKSDGRWLCRSSDLRMMKSTHAHGRFELTPERAEDPNTNLVELVLLTR
jgi:hypothetical protein